jgi:hypothetical protein
MTLRLMRHLATTVVTLLLSLPALSVELFRYRGAAKDGGTLELHLEASEQYSPDAVTKEKAVEIAADFMTTFYHVQVGALETQEFGQAHSVLADKCRGRASNIFVRFEALGARLVVTTKV